MEPGPNQAMENVRNTFASRDSSTASVLVLDGYGLYLSVSRGHLLLGDGLGQHRRTRRLPRAQRTVRRIVLLGHTGQISLEAVRWCTDTGITLLQIDADGTVLLVAGPSGIDDPRIRRAQAAAADSPVGLHVARSVLAAKLEGQAAVADRLGESRAAGTIEALSPRLRDADTVRVCREIEADAANTYFAAWNATSPASPTTGHRSMPAPPPYTGARHRVAPPTPSTPSSTTVTPSPKPNAAPPSSPSASTPASASSTPTSGTATASFSTSWKSYDRSSTCTSLRLSGAVTSGSTTSTRHVPANADCSRH